MDHGNDFATSVAGAPVNMPTHGHGQGYPDLNFLIPELVSGVLRYSRSDTANALVHGDGLYGEVALHGPDPAASGRARLTGPVRGRRRFRGSEFANCYSPKPWLIVDGDLSWSSAAFTNDEPAGDHIPGAVQTVVSAGVTLDSLRNIFGSARLRYFGPRPLVEDGSVTSHATSVVNLEAGYRIRKHVKIVADVFNLFNAADHPSTTTTRRDYRASRSRASTTSTSTPRSRAPPASISLARSDEPPIRDRIPAAGAVTVGR